MSVEIRKNKYEILEKGFKYYQKLYEAFIKLKK